MIHLDSKRATKDMFNLHGLGKAYLGELHDKTGKVYSPLKDKRKYACRYLQRQINELAKLVSGQIDSLSAEI